MKKCPNYKIFWTNMLGVTADHSDLPFECKTCLKILRRGFTYHLHAINAHQGIIDPTSSHIVLRFQMHDSQTRNLYLTDRFCTINDEKKIFLSL